MVIRRRLLHLAAAFPLIASTTAAAKDPAGCRRVSIVEAPGWYFSGIWADGAPELLVPDVGSGSLRRYDSNGRLIGSLARPGRGLLDFEAPIELLAFDGHYLLVDRGAHLVRLDLDLKPKWGLRLPDSAVANPASVRFLRSLAAQGREIVGLIRIHEPEEAADWWGFGRLRMGDPMVLERLHSVARPGSLAGDLYMLTMPLVATAGAGTYALLFGPPPSIVQLTPDRRHLSAFPKGFEGLPRLPPNKGPVTDVSRFEVLERSAVPVALQAHGRYLYLTTRRPLPKGGTTWDLHVIDPESDRLLGSRTLPTTASHLVLVPGSPEWAIFEKGPVLRSGQQRTESILFLSREWVEQIGTGDASLAPCFPGS